LRSIEPPYDQVRSEINRVVANMSSGLETIENDDPDAVDEMYEEFQQDLADLKARIKQSN
jgi:phage shock protein A